MKNYFIKILLILIYVLIHYSCSITPPVWIDTRPSDNQYFHGIGFASFSEANPTKDLAREYAIHEVASQIKINISSEMDIIVKDFNGSMDNAITSVLKSRVNLLLPELEFVGQYRSKDGIYYYVRLHKLKYQQAIERLRKNAKETGLKHILQADQNFGVQSFILLQKTWEEILPFNDEPLEIIYNGKAVTLYSLVKSKLYEYENRLDLSAKLKNSTVKTFIDRENNIKIKVTDRFNGRELTGIPVKLLFENNHYTIYTDAEGLITHDFTTPTSASSFAMQYLFDYDTLFQGMPLEGKYLDLSPKKHSITINVSPAKAIIKSSEKNLDMVLDDPILEPAIKQFFNSKIEFVNNNFDVIISIKANTMKKSKRMGSNFPYFTFGNASVSFKDAKTQDEFIYVAISDIKGADFESSELAGVRAYNKMAKQLISDIESQVINN